MKCPNCNRNQRRGSEGMICKSCSYRFLFDPQKDRLSSGVKLHDKLFGKIINHASNNGTYAFTPNQFFSSARHFGRQPLLGCVLLLVIFSVISCIVTFTGAKSALFFLIPFIVILCIAGLLAILRGSGPKRKTWDRFVERWKRSKREIPGLIETPALSNPPPEWPEGDIYDYGVSGILLCDRPEIVDFLVLNQFHTQTNTLVLTADGYPSYLLEKADSLMEESPDLPVYLFHDPTTSAQAMMDHCPLSLGEIIDLGLTPETMARLGVLKKRFGRRKLGELPLDAIPFQTLNGALTHCLANGIILGSVLGVAHFSSGSETETSFG